MASERNKQPILDVLQTLLEPSSELRALEIASGTGQHVIHFAKSFPNITWQPTDIDSSGFNLIQRNVEAEQLHNIVKPLSLDVSKPLPEWPSAIKNSSWDLLVCINMIHISPWNCTQGLFSSAGQLLKPSGLLVTYGPYAENGVLEPDSNVRFDQSLKDRNSEWGVRDIRDLESLAVSNGLKLAKIVKMPGNNRTLVFGGSEALQVT
ncbi:Uncharacterized protein HDE_02495 [Halotydeus destructor]|nr:Uncharacterized protein HDE_02495 [Halotydeus destructor]